MLDPDGVTIIDRMHGNSDTTGRDWPRITDIRNVISYGNKMYSASGYLRKFLAAAPVNEANIKVRWRIVAHSYNLGTSERSTGVRRNNVSSCFNLAAAR